MTSRSSNEHVAVAPRIVSPGPKVDSRMVSTSFWLLLFLLAFSPLAFGTSEHWSIMTVELVVCGSLFLCLMGLRLSGKVFYRVPGLVPLFSLLLVMVLQAVPIPAELLKILSPMSWEAYRPVYELIGSNEWLSVSVNQKATIQELLRIGSYVLFYILTIQLLRTGERLKKVLSFVVILAGIIALIAILQQFSSGGKLYWFRPSPGGNPGGPWVNINQYSAYIEMICPLAIGLFLFYRSSVAREHSFRQRFVAFFTSPGSNLYFFYGIIFLLLCSSVFISLCRGGIITILLSCVLFALLASIRLRKFGKASFWIAFCLVLLFITSLGWQPIVDEFSYALSPSGGIRDGRVQLWSDTLGMIRDYLLLGSGFGTYVDVYPSYKTIASNLIFDHAHNDYLELLSDGGVISFLLVAWFLLALLLHAWRKIRVRQDRFAVLLGVGAFTGICAALMHIVVDFNLHNGAVGLYFAFLCGLLVAIVNTRYNYQQRASLLESGSRWLHRGIIVFAIAFFINTAALQVGVLLAGAMYGEVKHYYLSSHLDPDIQDEIAGALDRAAAYDPFDGRYLYYRGNLALFREGRERAYDYYLQAAGRQPMEGVFLQRVGMMMPVERQAQASELMSEGYRRALNKDKMVLGWAEWLLVSGQRDEAKELLRGRLITDPSQAAQMLPILQVHRFSRQEILEVLPARVESWIGYGDLLEKMGEIEEAEFFRSQALEFVGEEEQMRPGWFVQLIIFYRRHDQHDKALTVIRQAIDLIPDYAPFHGWLGDYYLQEKILYRAREEYQQAVILDPENVSYRRKLKRVELDIEFGN